MTVEPTNFVVLVVSWLTAHLPAPVRVVTELPATDRMEAALPLVRVRRAPGGGTHAGETTVLFDVDVFDTDLDVMWATTTTVRDVLTDLSARFWDGALIDDVRTHSGPGEVTYENPRIRRSFGTYRLVSRAD